MINRDLQLNWLNKKKNRIEALKEDLKTLVVSPSFGPDLRGINQQKVEGIKFKVTFSKPKVHWYNWHYEKSIDIELKSDIAIKTIKEELEKEISKEEALYNLCKDEDFQEENCSLYRDYGNSEIRYIHPGCRTCGYKGNCKDHFDLKNKEEILKRPIILRG